MKSEICIFILLLMGILLFSCEERDIDFESEHERSHKVWLTFKESSGNTPLREVLIKGDELYVTITASGCDGSRWDTRLIDSGKLAYSNPPQRYAKIEFVNNEICLAVISRTFVFDLKPLRAKETRKVCINLEGWIQPLLYIY